MSWEERQQCQGSRLEVGMQVSDSICLHREGQEDARGGGLGACTGVTVEHLHYAERDGCFKLEAWVSAGTGLPGNPGQAPHFASVKVTLCAVGNPAG